MKRFIIIKLTKYNSVSVRINLLDYLSVKEFNTLYDASKTETNKLIRSLVTHISYRVVKSKEVEDIIFSLIVSEEIETAYKKLLKSST